MKKHLAERRERNRVLAILDALNRCAFCRVQLPKEGAVERFGNPEKFCTDDCLKSWETREGRR